MSDRKRKRNRRENSQLCEAISPTAAKQKYRERDGSENNLDKDVARPSTDQSEVSRGGAGINKSESNDSEGAFELSGRLLIYFIIFEKIYNVPAQK